MLALNWKLLVLVFENLDPHAVRRFDKRLIGASLASRQHVHTGGLPLRDGLLRDRNREADVVDHAADGAAVGRRRAGTLIQIHQHAGKPHDFEVPRLDWRAAHRHKDLLVGFNVA